MATMRSAPVCLTVLAALSATSVAAQSSLTAGATAGAVKLTDQRSEQALTGVVQYQARPWLSLSAMPSLVHVSDVVSGRSVASSGAGDLPVSAAAFHGFASPGSAVIAAALTLVLPVGNAACGLGSGNTSLGLDVGAGVSPSRRLHLSADASRSLSGLSDRLSARPTRRRSGRTPATTFRPAGGRVRRSAPTSERWTLPRD